ncbi:hypothetical protein ACEPAF_1791 [Sanghuangporus sanghuang]
MTWLMTVMTPMLYITLLFLLEGIVGLLQTHRYSVLSEPPNGASTLEPSSATYPTSIEAEDNQDDAGPKRKKKSSKKRKAAKSQATEDARGLSKDEINRWRSSTSRTTHRRRASSHDDYDSTPTNRFSARFDDEIYTPPRRMAPSETTPQERVEPIGDSHTESPPEPRQHFMNSRKAHQWFYTVYRNVIEYERRDLFLHQGGLPHEFAYILAQGWIDLSECVKWKDGRHTIGQGIFDLAAQSRRGEEWMQSPFDIPMGEAELGAFTTSWMNIERSPEERLPYAWSLDREDRVKYGPFGPALAHFARPDRLERIVDGLINRKDDVDMSCFPGHVKSIFDLLAISDESDDDLDFETDSQGTMESQDPAEAVNGPQEFSVDSHPPLEDIEEERTRAEIRRLEDEKRKLAEQLEEALAQDDEPGDIATETSRVLHGPAPNDASGTVASQDASRNGHEVALAEQLGPDAATTPVEPETTNMADETCTQEETPLTTLNTEYQQSVVPLSTPGPSPGQQDMFAGETPPASLKVDDQQFAAQPPAPELGPGEQDPFAGMSELDALEKAVRMFLAGTATNAEGTGSSDNKTSSEGSLQGQAQSGQDSSTSHVIQGGFAISSSNQISDMDEFARSLEAELDHEPEQGDGDCNMDGPIPVAQQSGPTTRDMDIQCTDASQFTFQSAPLGYMGIDDIEMAAPPMPEYDMLPEVEEPMVQMDCEYAPLHWSPPAQTAFSCPQQWGYFGLQPFVAVPEATPIKEEEMVDAAPMPEPAPVRSTALPLIQRLLRQKSEGMQGITPVGAPSEAPLPPQPDVSRSSTQSGIPQIVISPPAPMFDCHDAAGSATQCPTTVPSVMNVVGGSIHKGDHQLPNDPESSSESPYRVSHSFVPPSEKSSVILADNTANDLPDYASDDDKENAAPSGSSKASLSASVNHSSPFTTGSSAIPSSKTSIESASPSLAPAQKSADSQSVLDLLREVEVQANTMPT